MKKLILLLIILNFSVNAKTKISDCISIHGDIGKTMYSSMLEDLNIKSNSIQKEKTTSVIVNEEKISLKLAKTYGLIEKKMAGNNSDDTTTADEYAQGFMRNNARNFIIKYTFENKNNEKNIFLANAFISDTDCIVRFNGYLIVRRDF